MDILDQLTEAYRIYEKHLETLSDDDYVVNPPQLQKLNEIIDFIRENFDDAEIIIDDTCKKEEHAWMLVTFNTFSIHGKENISKFFKEFTKLLQYTSAFGIDARLDGIVEIGITVPKFYIHKSKIKN